MTETDRSPRSCKARKSGSRYGAGAGGTIAQRSGRGFPGGATRQGWHGSSSLRFQRDRPRLDGWGYDRGPNSRANHTERSFRSWIISAQPAAASASIERGPPGCRMAVAGPRTKPIQATVATTLPVAPWWQRCPRIQTRRRSASYWTSRLAQPRQIAAGSLSRNARLAIESSGTISWRCYRPLCSIA
jgi:hypothetical protein